MLKSTLIQTFARREQKLTCPLVGDKLGGILWAKD